MTTPEDLTRQEAIVKPEDQMIDEEILIEEVQVEAPPEEPEPPPEPPSYAIDPERIKQSNRSLEAMLESRRGAPSAAKSKSPKKPPTTQQAIREFASWASKKEDFIKPEMPMQEIIFRIILAGKNEPVSLENLHFAVTDRYYTPINPRNISEPGLRRVLDNDTYYGFVNVSST